MSTNRVSNIASNSVKQTLNSKTGELLQRKITRMPYVDVADRFLNDKKTSDAIKASMLPVVKKVENENWQTALETEFNKSENQEIKEDYEKIKENIDFAKFPKFNPKTLNKIIANLKNRQQWIHACPNVDNQELKNMLLKNFEDSNNRSIFTCFGLNTKKGKKVNQLPVFNQTNFNFTVKNQTKIDFGSFINNYNNIKTTLEELAQNEETFQKIKPDFHENLQENSNSYEYFEADQYKKASLPTWYPLIDKLKESDKFEDTLVLNDILKYINKSVIEDRELMKKAKEKNIPNANPKNIIPFFNEKLFDKALKMGGNQSFMTKYEQCYRDNIIEEYTLLQDEKKEANSNDDKLLQDENKKAKPNEEGFYLLDLNKKRKDTSDELHENELQFISSNSWCTHSSQGLIHGYAKHYYIILDNNKKVKFGGDYTFENIGVSRMESSTENNDQKFSLDMVKQILKLLKSQNVEIPFEPIHSDLRYLLALAIIKEKGIDNLKEEYSSIAKEYNLPILSKNTLLQILNCDTKNYIEEDNTQISIEQFNFLVDALGIEEDICESDKEKLKIINAKRFFEKVYNPKDKTSILTLNDINSKLQELGYSSIDINNNGERENAIKAIAKVVIESDVLKQDYINYKKVYQVVKQIGLTSDKENNDENSFLANLYNILKSYYITYLKFNINTICQNLDLGRKITISELTKKLNDLGFISEDDDISKYASPCYVDFEWDEEKKENEIANKTNNDNKDSESDSESISDRIAKLNNDIVDIDNLIIPPPPILPDELRDNITLN